jgi:hypothetical protein
VRVSCCHFHPDRSLAGSELGDWAAFEAVDDDGYDEDEQGEDGGSEVEVVAGEEAVECVAGGGEGGGLCGEPVVEFVRFF